LEKKITLYDEFISLLEEEWQALTRYSLPAVEEAVLKKQKLAAAIQTLEEARKALMTRIELKLEIKDQPLTLKNLLRMHTYPINRDLAKNRETLLEKIRTLSRMNDQSRELMDHSALSFKKSLAFLHATVEKAAAPYHADGRLGEAKNQGRLLSTDA
jgi:flagellar biosynthesis/type III secretory pathway chaperone